jgi:guanylate kinase
MDSVLEQTLVKKLANYNPSAAAAELVKKTPILLLVGPTGAGKDTLKDRLLASGHYHHIVSHTTRKPRINHGMLEKDGVDYNFITHAEAEKMLDECAMIESKIYSGNLYGTSINEIKKAHDDNKVAMTDIEVQGVAEYKKLDPNVMAIFLLPPSYKIWQERLSRRYGDVVDQEDMRLRMETALAELEQMLNTNYYTPVINDDLDETFNQVESITKGDMPSEQYLKTARQLAKNLAEEIKQYLGAE